MSKNDFLYVTEEELELYKNNPGILKSIEEERARDGVFSNEVISVGRTSKYLYTTEEEEMQFKDRPEVLERIDMERALSHDGITYKTPLEVELEFVQKGKTREKRVNAIMNYVLAKLNPSYCDAQESAELINSKSNVPSSLQFGTMSADILVNSRFYRTGNSGKYGNNFDKIEQALDSLNMQSSDYGELIRRIILGIKDKLSKDNYSDQNYLFYVNDIIILAMIVEKNYKIDREKLTEVIGDFESIVMDIITKINQCIINNSKANQSIVPNPVNFVSDVNGNEYIDIRELGMQLIAAYNTKHRLSDDRTKYKKGKIKIEILEGTPTIKDIPQEFIKNSNYTRINGRYGYYTDYSADLLDKKTFVIDEATGIIAKIIYNQRSGESIIIDNPTMGEVIDFNERVVR